MRLAFFLPMSTFFIHFEIIISFDGDLLKRIQRKNAYCHNLIDFNQSILLNVRSSKHYTHEADLYNQFLFWFVLCCFCCCFCCCCCCCCCRRRCCCCCYFFLVLVLIFIGVGGHYQNKGELGLSRQVMDYLFKL